MEFYRETRFKNSDIGRIPSEWNESTLGLECDIIMGQSPPSNTYNKEGKGIPFFQGNVDFGDLHPKIRLYCSDPKKIAEPNDILVSVRAPVGALNIAEIKCCIGRGLAAIRTNSKHNRNYIYFILQHFVNNLVGQGSTFKAVGKDDLTEFVIPVPPFKEEQRVASILSSLEALIQKTDDIIRKTRELKKGMMRELLTKGIGHKEYKYSKELGCEMPKEWEAKKIVDLFDVETGTTPSTKDKSFWEEGTINWITPTDLSKLNDEINITISERKITEKAVKECSLSMLPKDSIILSTRAPVGYVAVLNQKSTFNQGCKGLIPRTEYQINSKYYCYFLISRKDVLENYSGGSTFKELSKQWLEYLSVPYLSFKEQQLISNILMNIDNNMEKEKKTKAELEILKKGLMQSLLTGQVRIKVN